MLPRKTSRLLSLTAVLLVMPLAACEPADLLNLIGLRGTPSVFTGTCPNLPPPSERAIDVLAAVAETDPETEAWVIDLSQHYDAQDRCRRSD
jgi:hypothetical protein